MSRIVRIYVRKGAFVVTNLPWGHIYHAKARPQSRFPLGSRNKQLCNTCYPAGRRIVCPAQIPIRNIHRNKQNNMAPTPRRPPRVSSNFIFFFFFFLLRATILFPVFTSNPYKIFLKSKCQVLISTWFPGRKVRLPATRYGILCGVLLQATTGPG